MIQVQRLEGFYLVGKAGGYTRAAKEFPYPITQPGVHQQVRRLEDELGVRLFERVARDRVVLTPEGRHLHEFCRPFFEGLPKIERAIRGGRFEPPLRVRAAALELRYLLPPWIRLLRARHPAAHVELQEIQAPDFADLLSDRCDVIVDFATDVPESLESREVGRHRAFLVAPEDWVLGRAVRATLRSLVARDFISFNADLPHYAMQIGALGREGIAVQPALAASSTETILALIAAGLGYSLLPWPSSKGPAFPGIQVIGLRGPGTRFPIRAIWRRSRHANPLLRALLDTVPAS
jgi:DNA-binding transcriptional LysR family regulator